MTKEDAIKTLKELWRETNDSWYEEVYNMAINALEADRKTENSSEIPNNCTDCEHWSDTEDGCADRHGCKTTEDCSTVPTCSVNGRPYDCGNCEYHKCTADEPKK